MPTFGLWEEYTDWLIVFNEAGEQIGKLKLLTDSKRWEAYPTIKGKWVITDFDSLNEAAQYLQNPEQY